jgi:hypothetical protein
MSGEQNGGNRQPPNTRMQPDAAPRPQDRAHFGAWFQLQCYFGISVRAADAQAVGWHPDRTPTRSGAALMVMPSSAIVCGRNRRQSSRENDASDRHAVLTSSQAS